MKTKPWYQSVGFWGSISTAVLPILMGSGVIPQGSDVTFASIASAIASAIALYGRWRAEKPLSISSGK